MIEHLYHVSIYDIIKDINNKRKGRYGNIISLDEN